MPELKFEVTKSGSLALAMGKLANPKPLMAGVAAELLSQTEKAFDKEGYPAKWKKLAPSTIKQRSQKGHWPGKILQVSASGLAASIQPFSSSHQAGLTVSKPYAAIHQFGGQAGRGGKVKVPARPYMPIQKDGDSVRLTPQAEDALLRLTERFIGI